MRRALTGAYKAHILVSGPSVILVKSFQICEFFLPSVLSSSSSPLSFLLLLIQLLPCLEYGTKFPCRAASFMGQI